MHAEALGVKILTYVRLIMHSAQYWSLVETPLCSMLPNQIVCQCLVQLPATPQSPSPFCTTSSMRIEVNTGMESSESGLSASFPTSPHYSEPGDLLKSCPCAAVLLGRLPSDETPGVSSLGCVVVAGRVCLWVLLCCVHPIPFLPPHLPYPTVVPSVSYTNSTLYCL
jgi:hypothetical protein